MDTLRDTLLEEPVSIHGYDHGSLIQFKLYLLGHQGATRSGHCLGIVNENRYVWIILMYIISISLITTYNYRVILVAALPTDLESQGHTVVYTYKLS